ncbi:MAG: hypothetical protein ACYC35_26135 [Pirellulales bacterium]
MTPGTGSPCLQDVKTVLSALPSGETAVWDPYLTALGRFPAELVAPLVPLLCAVAENCVSVRQRLDTMSELMRSYQEFAINGQRTQEELHRHLHEVAAELNLAGTEIMTRDNDRLLLRQELAAARARAEALQRRLDERE